MSGRAASLAAAALAALLSAASASAHHSIGMIEIGNPVWVRGAVVRYEPRDPHVLIFLEERRADGQLKSWKIEGPNLARLRRMDLPRDFLKPGEVIEICGFPYRKDIVAKHASMPPGSDTLPALHAQLLVLPDGKRQPWGPYGKLDNCIRDSDDPQGWAAFLGSQQMAMEYWCKGLATTGVPSIRPEGFAEAVARLSSRPCP